MRVWSFAIASTVAVLVAGVSAVVLADRNESTSSSRLRYYLSAFWATWPAAPLVLGAIAGAPSVTFGPGIPMEGRSAYISVEPNHSADGRRDGD